MFSIRVRRQAERVGTDPTLSVVVVMEQGVALEKIGKQNPSDIGEDNAYNSSNPLFQRILYHAIAITIPSPPRLEDLNHYYYTFKDDMKQPRVNLTKLLPFRVRV